MTDPRHALWYHIANGTDQGRGCSFLLHATQLEFRRIVCRAAAESWKLITFRCSRRLGKTRYMIADAFENGVRKKPDRWWMKYAAPTSTDAHNIVEEHAVPLLDSMPKDLQPRWEASRGRFVFADGSVLDIVGCDDTRKANRLRGGTLHRGYIDEGGFIPNIEFLIESVMMPMTLNVGGLILMASTPSETPAHESTRYFREAEAEGRGFHRTIYDAPHLSEGIIASEMKRKCPYLTKQQVYEYVRAKSGPDDTAWLREYMAIPIVDASRAICSEFRTAKDIVKDSPTPDCFHSFVIGDVGFVDLTVMLFAYFDFERYKLVVQDEVVLQAATAGEIDEKCLLKEQALWKERAVMPERHRGATWEPLKRLADADPLILAELTKANSRGWGPCRNDELHASVNAMRMAVKDGFIEINPRCRTLIAHLESGIWNNNRTAFERVEGMGHFDAIAALVYLVRHVDRNVNPYPDGYELKGRRREDVLLRKTERQNRKAILALVRR